MLDRSSQSWLPALALALLAFFVYATHASHATCVAALRAMRALRALRALRAFEWKPGLRLAAVVNTTAVHSSHHSTFRYAY